MYTWSDYYYLAFFAAALVTLCFAAFIISRHERVKAFVDSLSYSFKFNAVIFFTVSIGVLAVFWNFFIGKDFFIYADIGSDTREQYFPYYLNTIQQTQEGTLSFWDSFSGLGTSLASYGVWLFDPFGLVVIIGGLLLGLKAVPLLLVISHTLKIFISTYLCSAVLKMYGISSNARFIGAILYGFSGFLMLWAQHYWFGTAYVFAILMLFLIERILKDSLSLKNYIFLCLASACLLAWSAYSSYMILLFSFVYLAIRAAYTPEAFALKKYFSILGFSTISVCVGMLLAGPFLFPSAYSLINETVRLSSDVSLVERAFSALIQITNPEEWFVLLSRFMSNNLLAVGSEEFPLAASGTNYYEFFEVSTSACIIIFFVFFVCFIYHQKEIRRRKILQIVAVFLCLFYFSSGIIPLLLYAGVSISFRTSFLFIFPIILVIAIGWDYAITKRKVPNAYLIVSVLITTMLLIIFGTTAQHLAQYVVFFQILTVLLFGISILAAEKKRNQLFLRIAIAVIVAGSVLDAFVTINIRSTVAAEAIPFQHEQIDSVDYNTVQALDFINNSDTTYYRVEKLYEDWVPTQDSWIQGYRGMTFYNATLSPSLLSFYENLWPDVFPSSEKRHAQYFRYSPNEPEITCLLNIKYILSKEPLDFSFVREIAQFGDVYVYQNELAGSIATIYNKALTEEEIELLSIDERKKILPDCLIVDNITHISEGFINNNDRNENNLSGNFDNTFEFYSDNDDQVFGTVTVEGDSLVCLALPNVKGWNVTVNGEAVDTFGADYGLIGFEINSGVNEIVASFYPMGLREGLISCIFGVALAIILSLLFARYNSCRVKDK